MLLCILLSSFGFVGRTEMPSDSSDGEDPLTETTDVHGRSVAVKGVRGFQPVSGARKWKRRAAGHNCRRKLVNKKRPADTDSSSSDGSGGGGGGGSGGGGGGGGGGGDAAAAAAAPPPERPRQQRRQRAPQSTTQAEQRITINFYFWNVLDAPPEEEWGSRDGAIAHCMKALSLPRGSNQVVKEVFTKTSQAAMAGHVYDPATSKNVGGLAKVLLAIDSPEAQIAADELEEGGSRKSATEKVNEYRLTRGLEHVGQGAVYSLMRRLGVDTKRVRKASASTTTPFRS